MDDILDTFQTLLSEHGKLDAIVESSFNGILIMKLNGSIISCNPAARKILKFREESCVKKNIRSLVEFTEMDKVLSQLEQNENEVIQFETHLKVNNEINEEELKLLEMKFLTIPGVHENYLVLILIDKSDVLKALKNREQFISSLIQIIDELRVDNRAIIYNLARLVELRDASTGKHLERVESYTRTLGYEYQKRYRDEDPRVTDEYIEDMALSSVLHDIGKIGITDTILNKPGKLNEVEYKLIQEHTLIAGSALSKHVGKKDFLAMGREIALNHHERWDGKGYPQKKKGDEIPFAARVVSICDVYDALTSERPYKAAFPHELAVQTILEERSKAFDPVLVDLFSEIHGLFEKISKEYAD